MTPFAQKLRNGADLTPEDLDILSGLAGQMRRFERGDILREGSTPQFISLCLEGWVHRYKLLEDGRRQITSLLIPGDSCDPFRIVSQPIDYTLAASTSVLLACVSPDAMRGALRASPRIEEAFWWDMLFSNALDRKHVVSLGRRSATERLGHFFCEMHLRLQLVGLVESSSYDLPLTQSDIADLFGLSAVQVNRSLQELRGSGFLSFRDRRAIIHDIRGLADLSMFDPAHLPLRRGFSLRATYRDS